MKKYFYIILFILLSLFVVILFNADDKKRSVDKESFIKQINSWKLVK